MSPPKKSQKTWSTEALSNFIEMFFTHLSVDHWTVQLRETRRTSDSSPIWKALVVPTNDGLLPFLVILWWTGVGGVLTILMGFIPIKKHHSAKQSIYIGHWPAKEKKKGGGFARDSVTNTGWMAPTDWLASKWYTSLLPSWSRTGGTAGTAVLKTVQQRPFVSQAFYSPYNSPCATWPGTAAATGKWLWEQQVGWAQPPEPISFSPFSEPYILSPSDTCRKSVQIWLDGSGSVKGNPDWNTTAYGSRDQEFANICLLSRIH